MEAIIGIWNLQNQTSTDQVRFKPTKTNLRLECLLPLFHLYPIPSSSGFQLQPSHTTSEHTHYQTQDEKGKAMKALWKYADSSLPYVSYSYGQSFLGLKTPPILHNKLNRLHRS
jgi:hypothetical protein